MSCDRCHGLSQSAWPQTVWYYRVPALLLALFMEYLITVRSCSGYRIPYCGTCDKWNTELKLVQNQLDTSPHGSAVRAEYPPVLPSYPFSIPYRRMGSKYWNVMCMYTYDRACIQMYVYSREYKPCFKMFHRFNHRNSAMTH